MSSTELPLTNALRVQAELREAILAGTLEPGARLRAEALAERLQTSRTPVREALVLLAREGLVELEPRRGATVRAFDVADLADLYDVRAIVEPRAAERAAERISVGDVERLRELCRREEAAGAPDEDGVTLHMRLNDEFHGIILAAAESPRLEAAMRALIGIPRTFRRRFWLDDEQRAQSLFCHHELVRALACRRAELAHTAMRLHIQGAGAFLMEAFRDGL